MSAQRLLDEAEREERWSVMRATGGEPALVADGERAARQIVGALRTRGVPDEAAEELALALVGFAAAETRARLGAKRDVVAAWERLAEALGAP